MVESMMEFVSEASVGERVLHLRQISGLSQRELAKRAGLTNSVISTIEQDKVSPSVSSLEKLLSGFGLDLSDFFSLSLNSNLAYSLNAHSGLSIKSNRVMQRYLSLSPQASTNLAIASRSSGVSIACVQGQILLRSGQGEEIMVAGDVVSVPASCAYSLFNHASIEASVIVAVVN